MVSIIENHSINNLIFFKNNYNIVNFTSQKKEKKVYKRENPVYNHLALDT